MKKKKSGTSLKKPIKPCLKCKKVESCTFEREWELFLNTRWSPSGRRTTCKPYFEYLKKIDRFADQDHVSQREMLASDAPVVCLEGVPGEENKYVDGFQYRMDKLTHAVWLNDPGILREFFQHEDVQYEYSNILVDYDEPKGRAYFPGLTGLENKLLRLRYVDNLGYREMCRIVNGGRNKKTAVRLTIDAAKGRVARAKKKLLTECIVKR